MRVQKFLSVFSRGSDVKDKLILLFAEDEHAKQQGHGAQQNAKQISLRLGRNAVDQNAADEAEHVVHGVELVDGQEPFGNNGFGVEDRGQIHQEHRKDSPKELCIAEEHHQGCQDQSHAVAEHKEHEEHKGQEQERNAQGRTFNKQHQSQGNQREQKVDAGGQGAREGIDILGHVDLVDQRGVAHNAHQTHVCGFAEEVKAPFIETEEPVVNFLTSS